MVPPSTFGMISLIVGVGAGELRLSDLDDKISSTSLLHLSCSTDATIELPMALTKTMHTTAGGMWYMRETMSLTPMKHKTAATPYFSKVNI
mmetsp:Transcript_47160/g.109462  ORF Transcript_47160/g.109462 Transcript_47160/m.109462 type:complete len:91 (+) Transcript_47160:246-518(+)